MGRIFHSNFVAWFLASPNTRVEKDYFARAIAKRIAVLLWSSFTIGNNPIKHPPVRVHA